MPSSAPDRARPVRVLRVIARMNVGGPAHHVTILSGRMDRRRFETLLVAGKVGAGEASADDLAAERRVHLLSLEQLGPEIRPLSDLRALLSLLRIIWRFDPDVVHTHTAKAGLLARLAAVLTPGRRPLIFHTYHGHVLEGYFGRALSSAYRLLESAAARVTDALVTVSDATAADLARLGVAGRERFRVIPLGLDLDAFLALAEQPARDDPLRRSAGFGPQDIVVTIAGRLVPIKRVDVALRAVARAREAGAPVRLLVVGDGELRSELEALAETLGIADHVHFAGFIRDMPAVVAATDIALLTSANEGTPVALIEAAAGARPAVATDVGGVTAVVAPLAGRLGASGDDAEIGTALAELASDAQLRRDMGLAGRRWVSERFGAQRLVRDVERLYEEHLAR
jgi:glycosyltransferase involved in cell wall biosynthesis